VLESAARLQRSLRRARVQIGVDRSKAQGKDLGRPRNATVDEEAIIGQVGNGASIRSTAEQHGIARSTVRAIVAKGNGFVHHGAPIVGEPQENGITGPNNLIEGNGNGAVWALTDEERLQLVLGLQIAIEDQGKVLDRLEAHEERRPLSPLRRELAESVKQRRELIGKFQRLLDKLRTADLSEDRQPLPPAPEDNS